MGSAAWIFRATLWTPLPSPFCPAASALADALTAVERTVAGSCHCSLCLRRESADMNGRQCARPQRGSGCASMIHQTTASTALQQVRMKLFLLLPQGPLSKMKHMPAACCQDAADSAGHYVRKTMPLCRQTNYAGCARKGGWQRRKFGCVFGLDGQESIWRSGICREI